MYVYTDSTTNMQRWIPEEFKWKQESSSNSPKVGNLEGEKYRREKKKLFLRR